MLSSSSPEIFITSSPDGPIVAYDGTTAAPFAAFNGSRSPHRGITVAGKSFVVVSHICPVTASGSIHLYNWWNSSSFQNLPVPEPVAPLAATSDGIFLFAGGLSGCIHTLSLPSGEILSSLPAHTKPVSCLQLSDDGSLLISGGDDGAIVVFPIFQLVQPKPNDNTTSKHILHQFSAHSDTVTAIYSTLGPSSSKLISTSLDGRCKFWCLLSGTLLHTLIFPCPIFSVALDPTETEIYAAGSDGSVYKASLRQKNKHLTCKTSKLTPLAPKHDGAVVSVILINEGQNLVSAAEDGGIWVWEASRGEVIMVIANGVGSISDLVKVRGVSGRKGVGLGSGSHGRAWGGESLRLSGGVVSQAICQTAGGKEVVAAAAGDVRRAIDMLESAIEMYEKMLELILREAKAGNWCNEMEQKESF